jgi:hypothetical protein
MSARLLPGFFASAAIAVFVWLSHGLSLIVTFVPTMILAYLCHLRTTARRMPDPDRILPLYLVALATQFLHFSEEFSTGFYERWPVEIFRARPYSARWFVLINMVSYVVFTLGAVGLLQRWRLPMLAVWFFTIMGVLGNAVQHPLYALKVRGYFPGLYTSLVYWLIGPLLFRCLWEQPSTQAQESRR